MKRRLLVVGCLGLLAIVIAVLLWQVGSLTPRRRLAVENYALIRMGISQAEVEELFGGPPGNYGRYVNGESGMTLEGYFGPPGAVERIWCDDENRFEIFFDANDCVVGHHRRHSYWQGPPEGVIGWLRRLLGI